MLFFRDNVGLAVGLTRSFFRERLNIRVAVHQDVLHVDKLDASPCSERRSTMPRRSS